MLFVCNFYKGERVTFLANILKCEKEFFNEVDLNCFMEIFSHIMNTKNDMILFYLGKYINVCLNKRSNFLISDP